MTYRGIFSLLLTIAIVSAGAFGAWTLRVLSVSAEVQTEQGAVLGAQTSDDSTPAAVVLKDYPVVTGSPAFANSRHYALYHVDSGKFLAESDARSQVPIASTTKLMTATVVLQQVKDLEQEVTISREAALQIGSRMELRTNEKITVSNLLYGLMLVSGNDAAYALAEYVGTQLGPKAEQTPVQRFVEEMNKTAEQIGMTQTRYQDPAGLNDEGHSSAHDLALLAADGLNNTLLRQITTTAERTVTSTNGGIAHQLRNSNRLVADYNYQGVLLGKTGFTPEAGHCLISAATRNGETYVAVILSTYSQANDASALEARRLLDWAFGNISIIQPTAPLLGGL